MSELKFVLDSNVLVSAALFLVDLLNLVEMVEITEAIVICRDPKDNKFLELAVSGRAVSILSSDKDLLVLHPSQEITILTPADFLAD